MAPTLLYGDLLRLVLWRLDLGNVHAEDAILAVTADSIDVHVLGQREAAFEAAVEAFHAMEFLVLVLLLLLAFALDRNHSVINSDLHILLLYGGQLRPDDVLLVGLANVRRRCPVEFLAVARQAQPRPCRETSGHQPIE